MSREALTASRMTCWLFCQRKHLHAYDQGVRSTADRDALVFGTAWHAAQEWSYNHNGLAPMDMCQGMFEAALATASNWEEFTVAKLQACIAGWVECVYNQNDIIAQMQPEVEFAYPIDGSRTFEARGKIDGIAVLKDGRTALVEHKTTSDDISPESAYWTRLRFNPQLFRYVMGATAMGITCDTVVYDVFRKPAIKPSDKVKDVDENGLPIVLLADGTRKIKRDGTPAKTADAANGEIYASHAETPEEYGERLRTDILARPEFYFARREVVVTDRQLEAFRMMEGAMAKQILDARERGRAAVARGGSYESAFMMNVGRMTCPGCDYEGFCMNGIELDPANLPDGYARVGATPELSKK